MQKSNYFFFILTPRANRTFELQAECIILGAGINFSQASLWKIINAKEILPPTVSKPAIYRSTRFRLLAIHIESLKILSVLRATSGSVKNHLIP